VAYFYIDLTKVRNNLMLNKAKTAYFARRECIVLLPTLNFQVMPIAGGVFPAG
jgi:hypothetical protein